MYADVGSLYNFSQTNEGQDLVRRTGGTVGKILRDLAVVSDYSTCHPLCVVLPPNAQVVSFWIRMRNANGSLDQGDYNGCYREGARLGECTVGWGAFTRPSYTITQNNGQLWCTVAKNWSGNLTRQANFTVHYN